MVGLSGVLGWMSLPHHRESQVTHGIEPASISSLTILRRGPVRIRVIFMRC